MRKSHKHFSVLFGIWLFCLPGLASALDAASLMGMLTGQLGVSEQQASGGAGALMDVAKQNLSGGDYGKLLEGAPDLAGIAGSAGSAAAAAALGGSQSQSSGGGWGGMLNTASSLMGGENKTLAQAAKLTESFEGLGLSPDMVGQFAQVTMDYVKNTGGTELAKMLAGALPF